MVDIMAVLEELVRTQGTTPPGVDPPLVSDPVSRLASAILERARRDPATLPRALRTALDEVSRRIDRVSLAVTGLAWLGSGTPSVEQEMISLVKGVRQELALCAYSITVGAMPLLGAITEVVAQGVAATLVVNKFARQPTEVQTCLAEAACAFPHRCKLLDFTPPGTQSELHAKVLVVDRSVALVGSANLSFHGMVSNHEMAVVVRGPTAEAIAARIDMLARGGSVRAVSP
jgi:phosphatidylserine/phosphatidylglycerophosphate/cardiolipin synthase-like enzyme